MCLAVFHRQLSPAVFYGRPDRHSCYGLTFSLIGDNVQLFIFSQRISFRHKMFPGINSMIIYPMQRTCPAKCDVRYHRASALVQTLPCLAAYLPFPFALPGVRQGPGGSIVKKRKNCVCDYMRSLFLGRYPCFYCIYASSPFRTLPRSGGPELFKNLNNSGLSCSWFLFRGELASASSFSGRFRVRSPSHPLG